MKIKAFAALVKQTKILHVYNVADSEGTVTQWVSNGNAMYPMTGMPLMEPRQLLQMMDIPEKDYKSYAQETYAGFDIPEDLRRRFEEFWDGESDGTELIHNNAFAIDWMGDQMYMLYDRSDENVYALQTKYLSPLSKTDDVPLYYYRAGMVAIKRGLLLTGLVYAGSIAHQNSITDYLIRLGELIKNKQKEGQESCRQ